MKITFDRVEKTKTNPNAAGKSYSIIRVHGTALEGKMADQPWTTQFFASNKELADAVDDLAKGDTVDVEMKKNGNFWNPVGFKKSGAPMPTASSGGSGAAQPVAVANPRLTNLEAAIKILGPKAPDEEPFDYLANAAGVADLIQDYVDEKGAFQFGKETSEGIPEVEDEG